MSNRPTYEELEQRVRELEQDWIKRKGAEEALWESEKSVYLANLQLSTTLETISDLMFEVNDQGKIYSYHAPSEQLLYVEADKFIGQLIKDLLPPDASGTIMSALKEAKITGRHRGGVYKLDMPEGVKWFGLTIAAKGD